MADAIDTQSAGTPSPTRCRWPSSDPMVGSGAKSDPSDAKVIAYYLRLRGHELRAFRERTRALRAVVRARTDLVGAGWPRPTSASRAA